MWEKVLQIVDRAVSSWLIYRAGKSSVINKTQEKLLEQIKTRDEIESSNDDTDFAELMLNNTGSH